MVVLFWIEDRMAAKRYPLLEGEESVGSQNIYIIKMASNVINKLEFSIFYSPLPHRPNIHL